MFKAANVGSADQVIRLILGIALTVLPHVYQHELWANPNVMYAMTAVGIVLILTGLVRFCPLYRLIGASTCKAP